MRLSSFRWRIFLAFILVIGIVVGAVSLFINQSINTNIEHYEQKVAAERIERMQSILKQRYQQSQSWADIQPSVEQMGQLYGLRIVVVENGVVIGDSQKTYLGQNLIPDLPSDIIFIIDRQPPAGSPVPRPFERSFTGVREAKMAEFLSALTWSIIWAGLVGVIIAIGLTFLSSSRVTAPIYELAKAAGKFGQGDFSCRVSLKSRDELGKLASAFNTMAEDLEHADKLKKDMVADVAHELRTPLSNIRGYVEAIRDGVIKSDATTLQSIHQEVMPLSRLVEDLHELALAESGELSLSRAAADIREIAASAVKAMHSLAIAKKLDVQLDLPERPALAMADTNRIGQVLRNLLANAANFTQEKGTITVSVKLLNSEVEVSVTDNGIGIPPDELPFIFERFHRVDKARSRDTGGSGLGLTIARQLVEAHGGSIRAESTQGEGSKFIFTLPAYKDIDDSHKS
jgi:signal transduction histidine kinase